MAITANDAFKAVCKYWDRVQRPEQLMSACINAFRVLTDWADTGAVCIAMPQDVEGEAYDYPDYFFQKRVWYMDRRPITQTALDRAVAAIKQAKRPLLICGGGVKYSEAWKELSAFASDFGMPIGETQSGKGIVAWDHPFNAGGLGLTGTSAANKLAKEADLVIGVGTNSWTSQPARNGCSRIPQSSTSASMLARWTLTRWMPSRSSPMPRLPSKPLQPN
jgi:3D-(3,5/4)-trihydroxycyclohexane-1,2-dione acylhydrolase (decyclizing)